MSIFLATIDVSIINVALPTLVRDLNMDFATIQWVILSYLLAMATLMLSIGRLGDMIGKKAIFTDGFVVFTVGSALYGLAPTVYWLLDPLISKVKALATREQRTVGDLVRTGLESRKAHTAEEDQRQAAAQQWLAEWIKMGEEALRDAPLGSTETEILAEDRYRLA